jgi:hypothetical protein
MHRQQGFIPSGRFRSRGPWTSATRTLGGGAGAGMFTMEAADGRAGLDGFGQDLVRPKARTARQSLPTDTGKTGTTE